MYFLLFFWSSDLEILLHFASTFPLKCLSSLSTSYSILNKFILIVLLNNYSQCLSLTNAIASAAIQVAAMHRMALISLGTLCNGVGTVSVRCYSLSHIISRRYGDSSVIAV